MRAARGHGLGLQSNALGFNSLRQNDPTIEDFGTPGDVFMAVINSYFNCCQNQPYSFFHEQTFRRLSEQAIPRHLVLAVIATAVRFCSHPYFPGRAVEMSIEYANRSWKLIVSDCFPVDKVAEISTVQTIALLGLFDFTGTFLHPLNDRDSVTMTIFSYALSYVAGQSRHVLRGSKLAWPLGSHRIADSC